MKKVFIMFFTVLLLALPSISFAQVSPQSENVITPRIVTLSWQKNNIATSTTTDTFYLSSRSSFKLKNIQQSTTSLFTTAKIEYRLLKQNSSGSYVDTGIYDVLEGSFNPNNRGSTTLYGSITSGTYKIKITNKNGSSVSVHSIGEADL